ncbi:hypothetical protein IMZ48_01830 [Candidatus Bathyarchaeota archaeon]|nr:hypothetical protein [Candidatus Bathyarchaeota archaeon]
MPPFFTSSGWGTILTPLPYSVQPAVLRYKVYEPLLILGLDKFSQGTYVPPSSISPAPNTGP